MTEFELQTSAGIKKWDGKDGPDACARYADAHPDETVFAWRHLRHDLAIGMIKIVP